MTTTYLKALIGMQKFTRIYCDVIHAEAIGAISNNSRLSCEGDMLDPKIREEWIEAIRMVIGAEEFKKWKEENDSPECLTYSQAFECLKQFISIYMQRVFSEEMKIFLDNLNKCEGIVINGIGLLDIWSQCLDEATQEENPVVCTCNQNPVLKVFPPRFDEQLNRLQAFNAMRKFLEQYYKETSSDDVGSLLGELEFLSDGGTADPAAWHDWLNAADKAIEEKEIPLMQLTK